MNTEILPESFLEQYRGKQPNWGFDGLGYIVYKRTYARKINEKTEEWNETIERTIRGAQKIGAGYTMAEACRLFDHMFHLRGTLSGRALWQLGTGTVDRLGGASLLNCWFIDIVEPEDFCAIFELLMLGGGVGFSVKRESVHQLPKIKSGVTVEANRSPDADFIVPDSREGWVSLVRRLMDAFFTSGKSFSYSTILIRSAGEPIKTFGGIATGPANLVEGVKKIIGVLSQRAGKKLRSVDVLDVANIIGKIVVSGNVRRSAEIAIGDPDDFLFIGAKRWDKPPTKPAWRGMSNNSIYADTHNHISSSIWDGYKGNGEAYGFINIKNAQRYGRIGEKSERKDICTGFNPCAEIGLESYECCNLSEIFLNNIEDQDQLCDVASLLYKANKAIAALPFHIQKTQDVVRKNMRIGIGVTGVCQNPEKIDWLSPCYEHLRKVDSAWSEVNDWPTSISLTTVKPSGTLSLLGGSSPGVHPGYSRYHIRRVRFSWSDPLVAKLKEAGYYMEDLAKEVSHKDGKPKILSYDHETKVVSFPCKFSGDTILSEDVKVTDQLDMVMRLQKEWSDNAVSCTNYYDDPEIPVIKEWLAKNYEKSVKSISFMKREHGFVQAPLEAIDEDHYNRLANRIKPLSEVSEGVLESMECASGNCPVK